MFAPPRSAPLHTWLVPVLLAIGAIAGCAGDPRTPGERIASEAEAMREAVRESIDDPGRRAQILALVDESAGLIEAQLHDLQQLSQTLRRINVDPDATRSSIEDVLSAFEVERRARRQRVLDNHFAMAQLTQPDEWSRIIGHELAALGQLGQLEETR
jgi:hypothetical protein